MLASDRSTDDKLSLRGRWHKRHGCPLGLTAAIWDTLYHRCNLHLTQYGERGEYYEIGWTDIVITCPKLACKIQRILMRMRNFQGRPPTWFIDADKPGKPRGKK